MSTHEERLTALEQTMVTRAEFNQYVRQQGQTLRDRNHEIAMPLGILTDDTRTLKENMHSLRIRMSEGFADLSQELYSLDEKAEKRFRSLETKVTVIEQRFDAVDQRFSALEQSVNSRFEVQDKKLDDILTLLKNGRSNS